MELLNSLLNIDINDLTKSYYRLIFIIDKQRKFNKLCNIESVQCINLNLLLSERLMQIPIKKRKSKVVDIFNDLLSFYEKEILLLEHIEVLFEQHLQINPIELLKQNSRNKILIVNWPGEYLDDKLIYAKCHTEETTYKVEREFQVIE